MIKDVHLGKWRAFDGTADFSLKRKGKPGL
jgi:hypothetical protein